MMPTAERNVTTVIALLTLLAGIVFVAWITHPKRVRWPYGVTLNDKFKVTAGALEGSQALSRQQAEYLYNDWWCGRKAMYCWGSKSSWILKRVSRNSWDTRRRNGKGTGSWLTMQVSLSLGLLKGLIILVSHKPILDLLSERHWSVDRRLKVLDVRRLFLGDLLFDGEGSWCSFRDWGEDLAKNNMPGLGSTLHSWMHPLVRTAVSQQLC